MESYIIYESGEIKSVSPLNGEDFSLKYSYKIGII